jgi:uncharacterized protein YbaP (TraB family)
MKRFISFYVILFVLAGILSCASSPASQQSGSSVWKVSRDGNTLFLGGSVHTLREADFPLPTEFDRAFAQSAVLVLEADVGEMENEEIEDYLMEQMFLPDNKTLQMVLDMDTYQLLAATCREYGFSINDVARLKPSMVITMISMLQIESFGFVQEGVDNYYEEKARKENKPVQYLETAEFQIEVFVSMGDGYENEFVRYSLQDIESTDDDISTLVAEWRNGGVSRSEEALAEMKEYWPEIYRTLVTDRNSAWMPQIEEFLASGRTYFVIVGNLHMHGPDGLLRQLVDSGYKVEQFR